MPNRMTALQSEALRLGHMLVALTTEYLVVGSVYIFPRAKNKYLSIVLRIVPLFGLYKC